MVIFITFGKWKTSIFSPVTPYTSFYLNVSTEFQKKINKHAKKIKINSKKNNFATFFKKINISNPNSVTTIM